MNIYLIPGLATDHRIFEELSPLLDKRYKQHFIDFLEPESTDETLVHYASRMAKQVTETEGLVILGLSLGGMIATEVSKFFPEAKLVILSSMKHKDERPLALKVLRNLKAYGWLSPKRSRWLFIRLARKFGLMDPRHQVSFEQMLNTASDAHLMWARKAALLWDNEEYPKNFIHIHGTNDHIFPHTSLKTEVKLIKGANHSMVINQAKETAAYINTFIS